MYPYGAPQYPDPSQVPPSHVEWVSPPGSATVPSPGYFHLPPVPVVPQYLQQNNYAQPVRRVNHGMHAVLTFATCGLWAPFWIIDALRK